MFVSFLNLIFFLWQCDVNVRYVVECPGPVGFGFTHVIQHIGDAGAGGWHFWAFFDAGLVGVPDGTPDFISRCTAWYG